MIKTSEFPFQRRTKIGILGGGQLGRMLAEAAHDFGLQTVVYCQNGNEPAAQIATQAIVGNWNDEGAIEQFATSGIRWVVGEWENVEPNVVEQISQFVNVHTMADVLRTGRSRKAEKSLAEELEIPATHWIDAWELPGGKPLAKLWESKAPYIYKSDNGGYDGKGQASADTWDDLKKHLGPGKPPAIVEQRVDLDYECSVLVERNAAGTVQFSPAVRNKHTNRYGGGILEYSYWSSKAIPRPVEIKAQEYAVKIAKQTQLVGVICVEYFVTPDGKLLFNEIAPRVHNSFHGSIEVTVYGQFHRHIAAVTGMSLLNMKFDRPWVMVNLIGDQIELLPELVSMGWSVHDYGKTSAKPGRKMGHATLRIYHEENVFSAIDVLRRHGLVE